MVFIWDEPMDEEEACIPDAKWGWRFHGNKLRFEGDVAHYTQRTLAGGWPDKKNTQWVEIDCQYKMRTLEDWKDMVEWQGLPGLGIHFVCPD